VGRQGGVTARRSLLATGSLLAAAPLLLSECGPWLAPDRGPARPRMGINLAGPMYWNSEMPFVDLMRLAGRWIALHRDGGGEVKDARLELDRQGWPRRLPDGLISATPIVAGAHLPRGTWVVRYDGRGEVDTTGMLRVVRRTPGRLECELVALDPVPDPQAWCRILATDPADPVRRIRVLKPGTESQPESDPWDRGLVERWTGWAALRFMDLQWTNDSLQAHWAERPQVDDRSFGSRGVAIELLVDLANRCGVDPWFCVPHLAGDDFVAQFAALVRQRLDPRLRVWVEHSNEVWNGQFAQAGYAAEQGIARGLASDPWHARCRYHAQRSREIFRLWGDAFAGTDRLRRVLSTQQGNTWFTREILRTGAWRDADALGVAAYVGLAPSIGGEPSAADVAGWSLERVFAHLEREVEHQRQVQREHRAWALRHGLRLVAYEGGQHAVALGEATRDLAIVDLFARANRDERMGRVYRALYDLWADAGGDLFCHFSSVSPPRRWGHWGLLEHHDDDPAQRPKYVATRERMLRWRASP
jgi:hypothetical protein